MSKQKKYRGMWLDHFPIEYREFTICKVCDAILCSANIDSKCNEKKRRNAKAYIDNLLDEKLSVCNNEHAAYKDLQEKYDQAVKVLKLMNTSRSTMKRMCYSDLIDKTLKEIGEVDGHTHVMPDSGPEHFENKDCWCKPKLDYKDAENGNEVWLHNDTRVDATN